MKFSVYLKLVIEKKDSANTIFYGLSCIIISYPLDNI